MSFLDTDEGLGLIENAFKNDSPLNCKFCHEAEIFSATAEEMKTDEFRDHVNVHVSRDISRESFLRIMGIKGTFNPRYSITHSINFDFYEQLKEKRISVNDPRLSNIHDSFCELGKFSSWTLPTYLGVQDIDPNFERVMLEKLKQMPIYKAK
jgi:hypothetical protein